MKLRIKWEGGGWESDDFQTSEEWKDKELEDLGTHVPGEKPLTYTLVGGESIVREAFGLFLDENDFSQPGYVEEVFGFLHWLYCEDTAIQVIAVAVMLNESFSDADDVINFVTNEDLDSGNVYICAVAEDRLVAYERMVREAMWLAPTDMLNAVDYEKLATRNGAVREGQNWTWVILEREIGGLYYMVSDKWRVQEME